MVGVADGIITPVDGFVTIEGSLDQLGTTTKLVREVAVAFVPGLSWNLLSTLKAVKQREKTFIYYRTKAALGFLGEESLVFQLLSPQGIVFSNRRETDPDELGGGARSKYIGSWASENRYRGGVGGGSKSIQHDRGKPHACASEKNTTRKTVEAMGIAATGQWRPCDACMQAKATPCHK